MCPRANRPASLKESESSGPALQRQWLRRVIVTLCFTNLERDLCKRRSLLGLVCDAFPIGTTWLRNWPHRPSAISIHASENPRGIPAQSPWVATKELPWVFPPNIFNGNAVVAVHLLVTNNISPQRRWRCFHFNHLPKVGAGAPTLGFGTQSPLGLFLQRFLKRLYHLWA